jgi:hypothetical protein
VKGSGDGTGSPYTDFVDLWVDFNAPSARRKVDHSTYQVSAHAEESETASCPTVARHWS